MKEQFERTIRLIGEQAVTNLLDCRVALFGLGGVGSYAAEALARAGVGALDVFDHDNICASNINRQLLATHETMGKLKVDVCKERLQTIHPSIKVTTHPIFYSHDTRVDVSKYDYIIDAIDTVTAKLLLIESAKKIQVPIISCMGTGNKLDPTQFIVTDIYKTHTCPLAKVMRKELKERGIKNLQVVYSPEQPIKVPSTGERKCPPGSISFVPPVAGLIMAGEVIKYLYTNSTSI